MGLTCTSCTTGRSQGDLGHDEQNGGGNMNRGLISTIIGVLVIIILVVVILRMT